MEHYVANLFVKFWKDPMHQRKKKPSPSWLTHDMFIYLFCVEVNMCLFQHWQLIKVAMVVWKVAESSNKVAKLKTLTGLALIGQTLKLSLGILREFMPLAW